jgi:hypothetical protein
VNRLGGDFAVLNGFNGQVVGAILEKEAIRRRLLAKKPVDDYSQSFGGTAADTKNEKEAADLFESEKLRTYLGHGSEK